jgi:hypothetical protein
MLAAASHAPKLVPPEMLNAPVLPTAMERIEEAAELAADNSPSRVMDRRLGRNRDRIDEWSVSPMPPPTEEGYQRPGRGRVLGIQARIVW